MEFLRVIGRYFQARTQAGQLKYDLVSNRAGNKWFVKSVMEEKDHSWRDATAELVLQVSIKEKEMVSKLRFCFFQSVSLRKCPPCNIPVAGPGDVIRGPSDKPLKSEAVIKHQTRMSKK